VHYAVRLAGQKVTTFPLRRPTRSRHIVRTFGQVVGNPKRRHVPPRRRLRRKSGSLCGGGCVHVVLLSVPPGHSTDRHRVSSDSRPWARERTPHTAVMYTPGCTNHRPSWYLPSFVVPTCRPERRAGCSSPARGTRHARTWQTSFTNEDLNAGPIILGDNASAPCWPQIECSAVRTHPRLRRFRGVRHRVDSLTGRL
jgi:hypothetical protein